MRLDILYQINEKYAPFCGVSMTSLFENNKHFDELRVFILGERLSASSEAKFRALAAQYHRAICFIKTDSLMLMMKQLQMPT